MDNREALKSMLNNLINDKSVEAGLDLHNYLNNKMKDVAGLSTGTTTVEPEIDDLDTDETDPE